MQATRVVVPSPAGSASMASRCVLPPAEEAPSDKYELQLMIITDYRRFAATTIQRFYRGWRVRASLRRQVSSLRGALVVGGRTS
jgi:hypothetical protein